MTGRSRSRIIINVPVFRNIGSGLGTHSTIYALNRRKGKSIQEAIRKKRVREM